MGSEHVVLRRTKILATLGPATESVEMVDQLVKAGVDVVRLNFSHGSHQEHQIRADRVRAELESGDISGREIVNPD